MLFPYEISRGLGNEVQAFKQKGVKQVLCVHDMVFWVITMPFAILPPHSKQVWFIGMPNVCIEMFPGYWPIGATEGGRQDLTGTEQIGVS
jgi:hypothetical protein